MADLESAGVEWKQSNARRERYHDGFYVIVFCVFVFTVFVRVFLLALCMSVSISTDLGIWCCVSVCTCIGM